MTTRYERVAKLVSDIRNSQYGEMVKHSEQLIDSGDWRDYTSPAGTRFRFLRCEYDYFLAAMEADATTLRHAYINAADPDRLMRLADITGKGSSANGDRRSRNEVAEQYADDPSGAGARIREWVDGAVLTRRTAAIAGDERLREDYRSGRIKRTPPKEANRRWDVRWSDDRTKGEAIADKLLADPDLAREVYKRLEAARVRTRREQKRRSGGKSYAITARKKG